MPWTDNEQQFLADFDRALTYRDEGKQAEALELLLMIINRLTHMDTKLLTHAHMQCGHIYDKQSRLRDREYHFKAAATLAPRYELASVCHFHALRALDKNEEALIEMVRFLALSNSEEYARMLSSGFTVDLPPVQRSLAAEARQLLASHRRRN